MLGPIGLAINEAMEGRTVVCVFWFDESYRLFREMATFLGALVDLLAAATTPCLEYLSNSESDIEERLFDTDFLRQLRWVEVRR